MADDSVRMQKQVPAVQVARKNRGRSTDSVHRQRDGHSSCATKAKCQRFGQPGRSWRFHQCSSWTRLSTYLLRCNARCPWFSVYRKHSRCRSCSSSQFQPSNRLEMRDNLLTYNEVNLRGQEMVWNAVSMRGRTREPDWSDCAVLAQWRGAPRIRRNSRSRTSRSVTRCRSEGGVGKCKNTKQMLAEAESTNPGRDTHPPLK